MRTAPRITNQISPQLQDHEPATNGVTALETNSRDCSALPMFNQRPESASSSEVPSYPTSTATSQNSLEFEDVDLGPEPCVQTVPEPNCRDRPALLRRLMKALSSAVLRRTSRQNGPLRQDIDVNGKSAPEPSFRDKSARPNFYQRLLKKPFSAILQLVSGTTNQRSSQPQDFELGRNSDHEEIPRDFFDEDSPPPRGKCCSMCWRVASWTCWRHDIHLRSVYLQSCSDSPDHITGPYYLINTPTFVFSETSPTVLYEHN
jgi:hypothetical protein